MLVGSSEILLDDSVRFTDRADHAELQVWHDMPHIFPIVDRLDEAGKAVQEMARFVEDRVPAGDVANIGSTQPAG